MPVIVKINTKFSMIKTDPKFLMESCNRDMVRSA